MFNFKESEEKWKKLWDEEGVYKFNPKSKKEIYSIDSPPPTVSGRMHIGHAFSYSQFDFIARYKRMKGYEIFLPFGTDDNGLATERLVEREKHVKSKDMTRNEFIKLCLQFLEKERPEFTQDWKDLGISCDWDISYSTISDKSRKIAQWSFLDLYKKGRVYRKDAPAMWCPECRTGVSQVEVQDKEIDSSFNDIKFKLQDGKDLIIATTRPELLPACVAVFYNPSDKRYKKYKGKTAKVPLFNFEVPILEDKRADPKKGTGIVMCCTFGDQTDMEWQKAYNLPIKTAITESGHMTEIAGKYKGLELKEARKRMIEDMKKHDLLVSQKPIKHIVNVHERCGTEIEIVKSRQWFVKYLDLRKDMLKWGKELNWHPKFMKHRYDNWIRGLQWDWLISNQRYFGIPFPVWYCDKCGEVIVAKEENLPVDPLTDMPEACPKCKSIKVTPEKDILNTWFTSSLSPQLAIELVKDEDAKKKLFPMSLRPQAHDIITFWLFNTVVKSRLHFNKNPWKDVTISGFLTLGGEKMSKSKGNVVKPQKIMNEYGSDALRYWAASSKLGDDFEYQEKDVITGKKFTTKLINASKFVFMNLKDYKPKKTEIVETDRLFLIQLNKLIKEATENFENYQHHRVKSDLDAFFWKVFCDNYLELIKKRVYNGSEKEKESAMFTLYHTLLAIIKMFAPITPFITEEVFQENFRENEKDKSIHISEWPEEIEIEGKKDDDKKFETLLKLITDIRQKKSEANKPMNSQINLTLEPKRFEALKDFMDDLQGVSNAVSVKQGKFRVEFLS